MWNLRNRSLIYPNASGAIRLEASRYSTCKSDPIPDRFESTNLDANLDDIRPGRAVEGPLENTKLQSWL